MKGSVLRSTRSTRSNRSNKVVALKDNVDYAVAGETVVSTINSMGCSFTTCGDDRS